MKSQEKEVKTNITRHCSNPKCTCPDCQCGDNCKCGTETDKKSCCCGDDCKCGPECKCC